MHEYALIGIRTDRFNMSGKEMCQLGKEAFLERAPPYVGDVLWEHLEVMKRGKERLLILSLQIITYCLYRHCVILCACYLIEFYKHKNILIFTLNVIHIDQLPNSCLNFHSYLTKKNNMVIYYIGQHKHR